MASKYRVKGISFITLGLTLTLGVIFVNNTLQIQEETKLANGYSRNLHRQPPHLRHTGDDIANPGIKSEEWGKPLYGMNHVIYFNAIPKTGCRSIARAAAILGAKQANATKFKVTILPDNILSNEVQIRQFIRRVHPPAIIGGHSVFVSFPVDSPLKYVNVLRDPLERLVSQYYFEQNGDSLRRMDFFKVEESTVSLSLDDCLNDPDCKTGSYKKILSTTINQLCGTRPPCGTLTREAMLKAKTNLNHYTMIGLTEELNTTVLLLEKLFPTMMEGLHLHFKNSELESLNKFKTLGKLVPSSATIKILQQDLALEYELYEEVKRKFDELKTKMGL